MHGQLLNEASGLNFAMSVHLHIFLVYIRPLNALKSLHMGVNFLEPSLLETAINI